MPQPQVQQISSHRDPPARVHPFFALSSNTGRVQIAHVGAYAGKPQISSTGEIPNRSLLWTLSEPFLRNSCEHNKSVFSMPFWLPAATCPASKFHAKSAVVQFSAAATRLQATRSIAGKPVRNSILLQLPEAEFSRH